MFKQIVSVFCVYALLAAQAAPAFAQLNKSGGQIVKSVGETGVKAAKEAGVAVRAESGALKGISTVSVGVSGASATSRLGSSASAVNAPDAAVPGRRNLSASSVERLKRLLAVRTPSITQKEIRSFVAQGDLSTPLNRILTSGIASERTFVLGRYLKGYAAPEMLAGAKEAASAMLSSKTPWSEGTVRAALLIEPSRAAALQKLLANPNALEDATLRVNIAAEVRDALLRLLKDLPPSLQEKMLRDLEEEFTEMAASPVKTAEKTFMSVEELKNEERWAVIALWAIVGAAAGVALATSSDD